jgi:hypothetical protein
MDKLKDKNIYVYRTDESATAIATGDGEKISFNVNPGSYEYRYGDSSKITDYNDDSSDTGLSSSNSNLPVKIATSDTRIIISDIDKVEEIVIIKNTSNADVNLEGWTLASVTGN